MVLFHGTIPGAGLNGAAQATNFVYREDFSSRIHCDTLNTTALWDTTTGTLGLRKFEFSVVGFYPTTGTILTLSVNGDHAFILPTLHTSDLYVLDISDPAAPTHIGGIPIPCSSPVIAVDGDYAYVAGYNGCFNTVDISDPENPAIIASTDIHGGYAQMIVIHGEYVFVAFDNFLVSVDISNPLNPVQSDYVATGNSKGAAVSGDYLLVPRGYRGTLTLNISDPSAMAIVDTCWTCPGYMAAVSGDHAFMPEGPTGLVVADISDLENVLFVTNTPTVPDARYVTISGDFAYVSDWGGQTAWSFSIYQILPHLYVSAISDAVTPTNRSLRARSYM